MFQQAKRKYELIERTNNERLGFFSFIQGSKRFQLYRIEPLFSLHGNLLQLRHEFFFQRKMLDPEERIFKNKIEK